MSEKDEYLSFLSDKAYKFVKYLVLIFLPALSAGYVGLASIWGWPLSKEISATIAVITVFLAAIFLISDAEYNKNKSKAQADLEALVLLLQEELEKKKKEEEDDPDPEEPEPSPSPSKPQLLGKVYLSPSDQTKNKYTGQSTNEAEQCEKIAKKLKKLLTAKGFEVKVASRSESMEARCKSANDFEADLYIPIHTNAYDGTVGGTRVFYYNDYSKPLAAKIYDKLYPVTVGASDNMSKSTDLYELHHTDAPSVYVEVEFHDVEAYAEWIVKNTELIAETLYSGICDAFNDCEIVKGKYYEEEPKEEPVEPTGKGGTCDCAVGSDYILKEAMKVRTGAGTNYPQVKYADLTDDGKAHAINQEDAVFIAGTVVTCLEVDENWIRVPSGWICAKDVDGTVYVGEAPKENTAVQAIRGRLNAWSDPYNQGYAGMCQAWVQTIYHEAGLTSPTYCCASNNRDHNAQSGDPSNGEMIFASTSYHNVIDSVCGRHAGHVAIYMDGNVYGSQKPYVMSFGTWTNIYGYGGHTNQGNW